MGFHSKPVGCGHAPVSGSDNPMLTNAKSPFKNLRSWMIPGIYMLWYFALSLSQQSGVKYTFSAFLDTLYISEEFLSFKEFHIWKTNICPESDWGWLKLVSSAFIRLSDGLEATSSLQIKKKAKQIKKSAYTGKLYMT